ncbi:MAG TPA: HDIG domain-containing protein [Candidatus Limnocylindria bacterium]|nr:HDIG domain-containing protein [Candidatus Limnocylindria bacterium]
MFITRTLAPRDRDMTGAAVARLVAVTALVGVALFAILAVDLIPNTVSLEVGDVATEDIRAAQAVSFVSASETEAARAEAEGAVQPIYVEIRPQAEIRSRQLAAFDAEVTAIQAVLADRDAGNLAPADAQAAIEQASPSLRASQAALLAALPTASWNAVATEARRVLDQAQAGALREDAMAEARQAAREAVSVDLAPDERGMAGDLAAAHIAANLAFSADATATARQEARAAVEPVRVTVQPNEAVVRAGDPITTLDFEKLTELGLTDPAGDVLPFIGYALMAALLAVLLVGFLWRFQPAIWHRPRSLVLFLLILLVSAVVLRLAGDRTIATYLVPTSAAVMLTGLLLGGAAGGAMAIGLAVVAGLVNDAALGPVMYVAAGGFASLVIILQAERLNAFVRAGLVLALVNVAVVVGFGLLDALDATGIAQLALAGLVNAALSVILAVGGFAVLGNVFGILTVFQMLELANPAHPLLRRLLLETPGTYHHSVMVGNLAERAAETIGADPLLARVAAYYHDIGKMKNPLAFIENQAGGRNIHDDLSPETSARIIAAHVRDGVELAQQYNLPGQIAGFIPQHHGTAVMGYFAGKAVQEGDEPDADAFRYPGPRPQTREAAIVMLADGVEASVRSLPRKEDVDIREMVDRIVDGRLADGQLDDSNLTLRDIGQIRASFVEQLLGMYHQRITYPENVLPIERDSRSA